MTEVLKGAPRATKRQVREGELKVYVECQWVLAKMYLCMYVFCFKCLTQFLVLICAYIVLTETLVLNGQEVMGVVSEWVAGFSQCAYICCCSLACWAVCQDPFLLYLSFCQAQMFDPPPSIFLRISGMVIFDSSKVLPANEHFHSLGTLPHNKSESLGPA